MAEKVVLRAGQDASKLGSEAGAKAQMRTVAEITGGLTNTIELQEEAKRMPFSELTKAVDDAKADVARASNSLKYNQGVLEDAVKGGGSRGNISWFEMNVGIYGQELAKGEARLRIFEGVLGQRRVAGERV